MTRSHRSRGLALLLLCLFAACDGCSACGEPPLAVLLMGQGDVQRDFARALEQWRPAPDGDEFEVGDGLRTGDNSRAVARVLGMGKVVLAPNSAIRFRTGKRPGEDPTQLDLTAGEAVLEAGEQPLTFGTAMGKAVLEAGGRIRMTPGEDGIRYRVELGNAAFETSAGTKEIGAGEDIVVGIGLALIEDEDEDAPDAVPEVAPDAVPDAGLTDAAVDDSTDPNADIAEGQTEAETAAGDIAEAETLPKGGDSGTALLPSLPYRDMSVPAGLSFRVYDPKPPTAIAFTLGKRCRGRAAGVKLGERAWRGDGTVILPVGPGMHSYSVHCLDGNALGKSVARGHVRVLRSAGVRKVAGRAPRSTVDTDGRHYTVMYQSEKPSLIVRWPRAPKATEYTLYVQSGGQNRTFKSKSARIVLRSGLLGEGTHKLFFSGKGTGGKRSKETTVQVAFDNAAPTVQITEPKPVGGFQPGSQVTVAGIAVPHSQVSLFSKRLRLDGQHRFKTTVSTPPALRALSLRFKSARHGVRYYLRRAAGVD